MESQTLLGPLKMMNPADT